MCFRKNGFSSFRIVTDYEARQSPLARSARQSAIPSFTPNGKDYGDPVNRLRWGLDVMLVTVRELLAIGVYRYRSQAMRGSDSVVVGEAAA